MNNCKIEVKNVCTQPENNFLRVTAAVQNRGISLTYCKSLKLWRLNSFGLRVNAIGQSQVSHNLLTENKRGSVRLRCHIVQFCLHRKGPPTYLCNTKCDAYLKVIRFIKNNKGLGFAYYKTNSYTSFTIILTFQLAGCVLRFHKKLHLPQSLNTN